MADELVQYLMEHADDLIPVMYDHARKLAVWKFGWREGKMLPLGKTPEDIVQEVYVGYVTGQGTQGKRIKGMRHFDPTKELLFQLKGSIRSAFSALGRKASSRNELGARSEEEADNPIEYADTEATPAESTESADFAKAVVEGVLGHHRVEASRDLQDLLAALELDMNDTEEQAAMLGKTHEQIYQLRFQLRQICSEVMIQLNQT